MDKIAIRVSGYEWALHNPTATVDVYDAYEAAYPGATRLDEGYFAFEQGAADVNVNGWMTIADIIAEFPVTDEAVRKVCQRADERFAMWCRKSGGTWLVMRDEAWRRWHGEPDKAALAKYTHIITNE